MLRALERPGPGKCGDAGLGRGVVRLAEVAALARDRRDDDDAAALVLLAHAPHRRAGARERPAQVGFDHGIEVFVRHVPQHAVAQDAGVRAHDVEASVLRYRTRHQLFGGVARPDGADLGDRAAARCGDGSGRLCGDVRIDIVDDEGAAGLGQRPRIRPSYAAPASGDHGDLVVEFHGGVP